MEEAAVLLLGIVEMHESPRVKWTKREQFSVIRQEAMGPSWGETLAESRPGTGSHIRKYATETALLRMLMSAHKQE